MKIIKSIKNYFKNRCWHEWKETGSFDKKMQNDYLRPIKIVNYRCVKCGTNTHKSYWKDLL